jgi:hypothetical protein
LAFLTVVPAVGQQMQLAEPFAPADMSRYGGGYRANEGFFLSFDALMWWPSKPDPGLIGDDSTRRVVITPQNPDIDGDGFVDVGFEPSKVIESSTVRTGVLDTEAVSGQRYDFGFIDGHHGWLCSILDLQEQTQTIRGVDAHVVFEDSPFGVDPRFHLQGPIWASDPLLEDTHDNVVNGLWIDDLQVKFDDIEARYELDMWGTELNYMYRMHPFHHGGIMELFLGARYMEIDDRFTVEAREYPFAGEEDEPDPPENIPFGLGDSWWDQRVENHVFGPQIGMRWYRKTSRWTWSTEARFFSGFNRQNLKQHGELGTELSPREVIDFALDGEEEAIMKISNMSPSYFTHDRHFHEWSPAAELRIDAKYQLTDALSVGAGWTFFWIDGIARAPNMIDYALGQDSVMGITDQNHEDILTHGVSARIELNR